MVGVVPPKCFKTGHCHRDIHPRSFRVTFYFNVHPPSTYLSNTSYTLGRLNTDFFTQNPVFFFPCLNFLNEEIFISYTYSYTHNNVSDPAVLLPLRERRDRTADSVKKNRINAVLNPKSIDEIKP